MVVERIKDYPALGRIAMRDFGQTVIVGSVQDVIHRFEVRNYITEEQEESK